MSTRFLPIKLNQDKLFGVGLEGTVGRADRRLLQDLADKCLERSRTDVVMDLSGLRSIGGGGAAILADFQRRLVAAGGEAVFAGTSDIVRHFLEQRFEDLPLRCYGDTADAEEAFYAQAAPKKQRARASARTDKVEAAKRPSQAKQPVVQESVAKESVAQEPKPDASEQDCVSNLIDEVPALSEVGAVSFFDDGEDGGGDPFGGASETPDASAQAAPEVAAAGRPNAPEVAPHVAPDPAPDPDPDAEDADGALDGLLSEFSGKQQTGGRRKDHQYMSLHDAVAALGDWSDVDRCSEFSAALNNLLFSHGLAEDVLLLVADGDLLVAGDRAWELPAGGGLADQLAQAARPTTLLDIQETDLDETELTFLETVEPDMILPVRP